MEAMFIKRTASFFGSLENHVSKTAPAKQNDLVPTV
jgi:hypothetical protein